MGVMRGMFIKLCVSRWSVQSERDTVLTLHFRNSDSGDSNGDKKDRETSSSFPQTNIHQLSAMTLCL